MEPTKFIHSLKINEHFLFSPCEEIAFSEPNGTLGSGINYVVGESGSGKTRLLELLTSSRLSNRNQINRILQNITDGYYQIPLTKAIFTLDKGIGKINFIFPDETNKIPSSGKNTYIEDTILTQQGNRQGYKRNGKNGEPYLISKNTLGTGEFSFDYLQQTLKQLPTPGIIVIEEPEYAKDPMTQLDLMKVIGEVAKTHQIFITTHSPIIIDWNFIDSGASIIKLSRIGEETVIGAYKGAIPKILINNTKAHLGGIESKSFLFANNVCIVEGQEDVGYIQAYINSSLHNGVFSDSKFTFFGYGAGGGSQIDSILKICADLKIPKVVALYDGDDSTKQSYSDASSNSVYKDLGYQIKRLLAPDIRTKGIILGVFEKSDGSSVAFSGNDEFKTDFEKNMKEIFDYFDEKESII